MARNNQETASPTITPQRAGRLYRLLTLTAETARTRRVLVSKLKVDVRGFYRDLELLRGLGIDVPYDGTKYQLEGELEAALSRLPFPDPGLSFRDALTLARGGSEAHRKLKRKLDGVLGPNGESH